MRPHDGVVLEDRYLLILMRQQTINQIKREVMEEKHEKLDIIDSISAVSNYLQHDS